MKAIQCQYCDKVPTIKECGKCREITKYDLACFSRGEKKVYIWEGNHNTIGRKQKIHTDTELEQVYNTYIKHNSYLKAGIELGISKDTVRRLCILAKKRCIGSKNDVNN